MENTRIWLLISALLLFVLHQGSAIDCWVCSSGSDSANCGETVNELNLQDSLSTASNCAACGKTFSALGTIFYKVERTCLSSMSDTCDNKLGYGTCTCSTTYCNGQNGFQFSWMLMVLSSVLAVVVLKTNL